MKIIKDLSEYKKSHPLALSLGMFDGVHVAHTSIINALNRVAEERHYISALYSFWPHPKKLISPSVEVFHLTTLEEKINLLEEKQLDFLFLQNFDEEFRNLEAERFVEEILVKTLGTKYIIVGYDHCFGKDKKGNFQLLKEMGEKWEFEVKEMEEITLDQCNVSSTKVRQFLLNGEVRQANEMLGYSYFLSGRVIHGKKIGRTIGYPTANIEVDVLKLLPRKGAYIVEVWLRGKFYKGMLSIGTNPTIGGERMSVEVYILDFEGNIYGENILVKFRDFLHKEIKFDSLEKLIERLDEDKKKTEIFFS